MDTYMCVCVCVCVCVIVVIKFDIIFLRKKDNSRKHNTRTPIFMSNLQFILKVQINSLRPETRDRIATT